MKLLKNKCISLFLSLAIVTGGWPSNSTTMEWLTAVPMARPSCPAPSGPFSEQALAERPLSEHRPPPDLSFSNQLKGEPARHTHTKESHRRTTDAAREFKRTWHWGEEGFKTVMQKAV